MYKYQITITEGIFSKEDFCPSSLEVALTQTFMKFGAMLLWSQDWFKTTGANRTIRRDLHTGKKYRPSRYAQVEGGNHFNLYRNEDYREFTEAKFLESYLIVMAHNERYRSIGISSPPHGMHIVDVYQNAGHKNNIVLKTMYVAIIGSDNQPKLTLNESLREIRSASITSQTMLIDTIRDYASDTLQRMNPRSF